MKANLFVTFTVSLLAIYTIEVDSRAVLYGGKGPNMIEGEYIIVLHGNISKEAFSKHLRAISEPSDGNEAADIQHVYDFGSFKGYSAKMSRMLLQAVLQMPETKYIEQNQMAYLDCNEQYGATWGLVRTSERDLDLEQPYKYLDGDGSGVNAYVIDTGIFVGHDEFANGRALPGVDLVNEGCLSNQEDIEACDGNGHGTHVAGTIVGNAYGIAKGGTAIAVKVLDKLGAGNWDDIIEGILWVAEDHQRRSNKKSVANMSLGGSASESINDAVNSAVEAGVVFCVSAGNNNFDSCQKSPASAERAITVGSTTETDDRSDFSNFGECVTIFAPGSLITSAWIDSKSDIKTISGTSMAAPHAAGVSAKYLSRNPTASPEEVKEALLEIATEGKIKELPADTVNKLLFMDCA